MMRLLGIVVSLICFGAMVPVSAYRAAADLPVFPATIDLPAGFRPEGIEIGLRPVAYLGSAADGSIYRADLVTGQGSILSPGSGTPSLGLRLDHRSRLFVAGGTGGDARVVDARTGVVLANYRLGTPRDTFVNDVVLTSAGAWFTDSRMPVLYHLPLGADGALPPPEEVVRLPLTGDLEYVPEAINANGIVLTPDGTGLIIVQSATGQLFHVDPTTGETRKVDLGDEEVPHGDGLLLNGDTLLVVQNRSNTIAVIVLDPGGASGTVRRRITDPRFDVPTTVAVFGPRLYLPNARYDTPPSPATRYTAVAVDRPH
uniref:SMP-30/gluconolactonase/LRE family protein n=1 Tax=Nocardia donostiensis TaxID=1538463 RepID=UPI001FE9489C|nr:SMP-30/gluconolactonase/LRE family protein [Nocardia donostiensis]